MLFSCHDIWTHGVSPFLPVRDHVSLRTCSKELRVTIPAPYGKYRISSMSKYTCFSKLCVNRAFIWANIDPFISYVPPTHVSRNEHVWSLLVGIATVPVYTIPLVCTMFSELEMKHLYVDTEKVVCTVSHTRSLYCVCMHSLWDSACGCDAEICIPCIIKLHADNIEMDMPPSYYVYGTLLILFVCPVYYTLLMWPFIVGFYTLLGGPLQNICISE